MINSNSRVPYLDGWRGIAVLLVLIGHFTPIPGLNAGPLGVELFFVLSGRLMADILFVQQHPLPSFFRRRLSRVVPALLLFATSMLALSAAGRLAGKDSEMFVGAAEYLAAITFLTNYAHAFAGATSVLNHTWSLSVEEHAYILLASAAFFSARSGRRGLLISSLLAIAAMTNGTLQTAITGLGEHEIWWKTDTRVGSIFVSAAVFLWLREHPEVFKKAGLGWVPLAALAGGVLTHLDVVPLEIRFSIGTTLLALALNLLPTAPAPVLRALSLPIATGLGTWSYSIYLWQQPFYKASEFLPWPICLTGALLVGYLSFQFVEQPARKWLNAHWGKSRERAEALHDAA